MSGAWEWKPMKEDRGIKKFGVPFFLFIFDAPQSLCNRRPPMIYVGGIDVDTIHDCISI